MTITRLYLAANQIPVPGTFFGHLQIVAQQDDGSLIETEVHASLGITGNWVVSLPSELR